MEPLPLFLSLVFSLCADWFFLATPYEFAGVLLFLLVQDCHRRLLGASQSIWLTDGLSLALPLILAASVLTKKGSLLLVTALLYFCLLLCNFIYAWKHRFRTVPLLFCICLSLLVICDLHVGLYNLPRFLPGLSETFRTYCRNTAFRTIWLFYIPSQFMILYLLVRSLSNTRSRH